jgi:hypothetical protein
MKKTLILTCFLLAIAWTCMAQQIEIKADTLTKPSYNYKAPLAAGLQLHFTHSNVGDIIKIENSQHEDKTVKSNFSLTEQSSYTLTIEGDGSTLTFSPANAPPIIVASTPVIITYNNSKLTITNVNLKQASPKSLPVDNVSNKFGVPIHDAVYAAHLVNDKKFSDLANLLAYLKNLSSTDQGAVKKGWENNPFIKPLLDQYFTDQQTAATVQGGGIPGFIGSVGNTNVSTVVDGISKFLVKRAKQELTVSFFQHFKDLLNEDRFTDVRLLFPKTVTALNLIDQDIYQYSNYINSLRSAFDEDFSLILDHFPDVINQGRYKAFFTEHKDIKYSALLSLFVAKESINGTHPGKILETLPQYQLDNLSPAYGGGIETVQLLSMSIRSREAGKYYTSLDTLKMLISKDDPKLLVATFYLGFIYEKATNIYFGAGQTLSLAEYLKPYGGVPDSIRKYVTYIQQFGQLTHNVEASIQQIAKTKLDSSSAPMYHRMFSNFADVLDQAYEVRTLPGINRDHNLIDKQFKVYIDGFRKANDLAMDLVQKDYSASANDAYSLYTQVLQITKKSNQTAQPVSLSTPLYLSGSTLSTEENHKQALKDATDAGAILVKYGNFMANVIKAKSSDDVESAIESVALPVGSASIKKHFAFSIALNAYVGPYLGSEKIRGVDDGGKTNAYGLTAPIGISLNSGWLKAHTYGFSVSAFLSVIDLGAPVAFRFADSKTEQIPNIQLKDIISPGAFLSVGIPGVPLSVNAGWQMGPNLRNLVGDAAKITTDRYDRFSVSLVVDIPIFNIYKSASNP